MKRKVLVILLFFLAVFALPEISFASEANDEDLNEEYSRTSFAGYLAWYNVYIAPNWLVVVDIACVPPYDETCYSVKRSGNLRISKKESQSSVSYKIIGKKRALVDNLKIPGVCLKSEIKMKR